MGKDDSEDMGFFLQRAGDCIPEVCKFTSQLFYENKLGSDELARARVMEGHPWGRERECGLFQWSMKETGAPARKKSK